MRYQMKREDWEAMKDRVEDEPDQPDYEAMEKRDELNNLAMKHEYTGKIYRKITKNSQEIPMGTILLGVSLDGSPITEKMTLIPVKLVRDKDLGWGYYGNQIGQYQIGTEIEEIDSDLKPILPKKEKILPPTIQEKIDKGDFGCRKESVQALIEAIWTEKK